MGKLPAIRMVTEKSPDPALDVGGDGAQLSPAQKAIRRLEKCKVDWHAAAGKARQALWTLLATIFVAHEAVKAKDGGREIMVKLVENMPDYSKGQLDPKTKSLLELLVIYSIGFERETAASRCQYVAAVKAAIEDPNLKRTEAAFLAWLKRKGGITAAGAASRASDQLVVPFKFEVFKHHIASMARRGTIQFRIDPETEVDEGLTVILASFDPEHPDQLQVVEAVGDESVIQRVSQAVAANRAKKLPEDAKRALLNEQHLWDLNRIAMKLAKKNGHVTWEDADRWARAHLALHDGDAKERKLFSGPYNRSEFADPSGTDKLTLPVENLDYHEFDPGRYIKTARKGALMPYDPSDSKAVEKYILKHTEPYIYAKPIELPDAAIASEARHEKGDSAQGAEEGEA